MKLNQGMFRLDMSKSLFYDEGDEVLEELLREVVDAPSLETFQVRMDGV